MTHPNAADLVIAAQAKVRSMSVEEVAAQVESGDAVVVDVREAAEIEATGRIPGAVTVPRGMLEVRADPASDFHEAAMDPDKPTILYCAGGPRSVLAGATLQDLGYTDVAYLTGGAAAWTEADRPTEQ